MPVAVMVSWTESERGWGQRPDGYSFHLDNTSAEEFIEKYWDGMPDGPAPDEYSRPDGSRSIVSVTKKFYKMLIQHRRKNGIRIQNWQWPKYKEHVVK